ncbi:hypothetical protein K492DRAFT_199857 [Lichtheimia hyalospora FSU 10163]|nr:hypothetical protein K492DRAFT_199857 [Lichtheimia hyalospora FSU 10163]
MFDHLPAELLWGIALFLPSNTLGALAQTCHHCYNAILPMIYQDLSLVEPNALFNLSSKLVANPLWLDRARKHVRKINISQGSERTLAKFAMLDHIFSGWDLLGDGSVERKNPRHHIDVVVAVMFTQFPNVCSIALEFDAVTDGAICSINKAMVTGGGACFSGDVKLFHYRPGNSSLLYALLYPFPGCTRLALHTRPYLSLCAAIQDSLLLQEDIDTLTSLGLKHVRYLDLAYIDDMLPIDSIQKLVEGLINIKTLIFEWVLPPSMEYFDDLCQCLAETASLYPDPVEKLTSTYRTVFRYYNNTACTLLRRMSVLRL